jgi:hypothetical protein
MILMSMGNLADLGTKMEEVAAEIKAEFRGRYPLVVVTEEEAVEDEDSAIGDTYPGDREVALLSNISNRALVFESLTVPETYDLLEWLERHAWILEGGT